MIRIFALVAALIWSGSLTAQQLVPVFDKSNTVVIETTKGRITIRLNADLAPNHAERIKQLARDGYYDSVPFHRVMDGFMAQTGDGQNFNGTGGSKYPNLKAEFSSVPFTRGVVGMARSASSDSANSQFFIMLATNAGLNGKYTVIGDVVAGMDVVDKLKKAPAASVSGAVTDPDKMLKMQVAPDTRPDARPLANAPAAVAPIAPAVAAVSPAPEKIQSAGRRVALVVGNGSYKNMPTLTNPANDAADVGRALESLGFETTVATDLDRAGMNETIGRFSRRVNNADIAVIYYAGHGMQFQGRNYLLPIDANLESVTDVNRFQLTPVDDLVDILGSAKGLQLIVLDACRNNPVERDFKNRIASASGADRDASSTRGFSRIEARSGLVMTYATSPNSVAADGNGRNSPFTRAFLDNVGAQDVEIRQMLYKVQSDVYVSTNKRQLPEISSLYIGPDIRLKFGPKQ